ncbi:DinI family protein, partial [Shigella sonnei]|nr:DinI family protein [Shigella sonnei]
MDVELCGDGLPAIRLLLYRSILGYFNIAML